MKKTEGNQIDMGISVSNPSTPDLRGRQSVRATFRLSEACIDAISILSAQLGIKQKSIFDHLLENAQVLKSMASELENTEFDHHERIQKTFVISRRSLSFKNGRFSLSSCLNLAVLKGWCKNGLKIRKKVRNLILVFCDQLNAGSAAVSKPSTVEKKSTNGVAVSQPGSEERYGSE